MFSPSVLPYPSHTHWSSLSSSWATNSELHPIAAGEARKMTSQPPPASTPLKILPLKLNWKSVPGTTPSGWDCRLGGAKETFKSSARDELKLTWRLSEFATSSMQQPSNWNPRNLTRTVSLAFPERTVLSGEDLVALIRVQTGKTIPLVVLVVSPEAVVLVGPYGWYGWKGWKRVKRRRRRQRTRRQTITAERQRRGEPTYENGHCQKDRGTKWLKRWRMCCHASVWVFWVAHFRAQLNKDLLLIQTLTITCPFCHWGHQQHRPQGRKVHQLHPCTLVLGEHTEFPVRSASKFKPKWLRVICCEMEALVREKNGNW